MLSCDSQQLRCVLIREMLVCMSVSSVNNLWVMLLVP